MDRQEDWALGDGNAVSVHEGNVKFPTLSRYAWLIVSEAFKNVLLGTIKNNHYS
jgi:hypothetical protein